VNRINHNKLLHSKWTAAQPQNREKHFIVTKVNIDSGSATGTCIIEAVRSKREIELEWRELKKSEEWKPGWL
jgi:tryptophan-rich hypothetical protein